VQASGAKCSELSARTIHELANAYLEANRRALIEQAIATIARSPTFRKYYGREQRERAKLERNAQTQKPCSSKQISVQNSGAK
jgi:hypothetical protein